MTEDTLSAELITEKLGTRFIGRNVLYYPSVASTMDIARREARAGAPEGTAVIAGEQTSGRGRLKRNWLSPPGSLSLSLILRPPRDSLPRLVMLTSLAVAHCIEEVTDIKASIKWPNDVLVNSRKVCGILVETDLREEKGTYAVIGIGLNVNFRSADYSEIPAEAASLSDELDREVSRLDITRCLLREIEKLYLTLPGSDAVFRQWRARLVTLGRRVTVTSGTGVLEGAAESVTENGILLLRLENGNLTEVVAGDVALQNSPADPP